MLRQLCLLCMYDKLGRVPSTTNGERTRPTYSGVGNVEETMGAPGTSVSFTYNALNRLVKAGQLQVHTQDGVARGRSPFTSSMAGGSSPSRRTAPRTSGCYRQESRS